MASCHSLSYINGHLTGDPLDTYMFNFTQWKFLGRTEEDIDAISTVVPPSLGIGEPDPDTNKLHVVKLYPFHSSLQRMSVIVKEECSGGFTVYTKGSPEVILSMCSDDSKPDDILLLLEKYAKDGHRLLAVSTKYLPANYDVKPNGKFHRSDVECNLTFLGFIVFENALKPTSSGIIKTLDAGNIRVAMATGDNLYTAVAVARDVGIIKPHQKIVKIEVKEGQAVSEVLRTPQDELKEGIHHSTYYSWSSHALNYTFVLTGESYISIKERFPDIHRKVLVAGSVFARMSPDQKTIVINDLKNLGYGVGMCGDGANDCGALKAAHAGIALSTSEASVASPFTSTKFDISCVPILIREGRSTLVTSFSAFKYLALYCFIQFFGVLILYSMKSNYGDYQFLYADLVLCFPLIFTMIQGESSDRLISKRPPGRLFHPIFISGILVQIAIQFFFQLGVCQYVGFVNWYKKPAYFHEQGEEFMNFENYVVLMVSFYQYIWLSVVYYPGRPYNRPLWTNVKYMLALCVTLILTIIINFYPGKFLQRNLEFPTIPDNVFNVSIFCTAVLNLYISYMVECFFQQSNLCRLISRKILRKTKPRNLYKHVISEMHNDEISNGKVV